MELPFAEDIGHYWQTSNSSPDTWLERAKKLIMQLEGTIVAEGYGFVEEHGAYMLAFKIGGDSFKVVWPVLPTRTGKSLAAKRQAATLLYHDIKAKAMTASVLGAKVAFFSYLMLVDGRTASELATPELPGAFPFQLKQG
ncbi:hypothetical protein ES703_05396 [subsurface metagenome]